LGVVFLYEEHKSDTKMKINLCLAAGLMALNLATGFAQQPPPSAPNFQQRLAAIQNAAMLEIDPATGLPVKQPELPKFDLDFKGGTPDELVKQIEKANGKPLNVIIRPEDALEMLPPLKMSGVTVPQLFAALEAATSRMEDRFKPQTGQYEKVKTGCGFKSPDSVIAENSIWFFNVDRPEAAPAKVKEQVVLYYSLAPYLDRGFTVDDITTAIQAGWKMSGLNPPPELNYHKETQMLVAYGEPEKLQTIRNVLDTLPAANANYWKTSLDRMNKLQAQIDQLKQQLAATTNSPADKSGK
jgi:hypothetical protein